MSRRKPADLASGASHCLAILLNAKHRGGAKYLGLPMGGCMEGISRIDGGIRGWYCAVDVTRVDR